MATVKLFGAFGDSAGWTEQVIDASTLGGLKAILGANHPRLGNRLDHPSTMVILNNTIVPHSLRTDSSPISDEDEIAFGPPVSGG